jgi:hypothetical protein
MCISGFKRSKSSTPVKKVPVKKKKTLIKKQGGDKDNSVSPTSSVSIGTQGLSGHDSFGNKEGQGMGSKY